MVSRRRCASLLEPVVTHATPSVVREWEFLAWLALLDVCKYLRRASLWEALERLNLARTYLWRIWAAQNQVDFPLFGVTSVFDAPGARAPDGLEDCVAVAETASVLTAARACARLLRKITGSNGQGIAHLAETRLAADERDR